MNTFEKTLIALIILTIALSVFSTGYTEGHRFGYLQGCTQTIKYYNATSEFPSKIWLEANEATHFKNADELLDSLKQYEGR